jgi:hypothetical protein
MKYEVKIIDGVAVKFHSIVVLRFSLGDGEDPDIYAAELLWHWQQSERGKWVMENAVEKPVWHRHTDFQTMSTMYAVTAKFKEQDAIIWALKWGS